MARSSSSSLSLPPKSDTLSTRPVLVPQSLCLLCSSSITASSSSSFFSGLDPVETKCCRRSICSTCVGEKGRAARWDPCLVCSNQPRGGKASDDDTFVLGDDEDEGEDSDEAGRAASAGGDDAVEAHAVTADDGGFAEQGPIRHIVRKGDTLIGISLKYGVDPHHLCTLNRLPQSTIHTTPHLLQTRSYILLLPSPPPPLPASVQTQIAHDRAIARFGKATKVADASISRSFVALAELDQNGTSMVGNDYSEKEDKTAARQGGSVEDRAVDAFFEDLRWEAEQGGSRPRIPSFPTAGSASRASSVQPRADKGFDWSFGWGKRPSTAGAGGFIKIG